MLELINNYSLHDILVFLVIFALAIKSIISFWDWAIERIRKIFHKENSIENEKNKMQEHLKENFENIKQVSTQQQELQSEINNIINKINLLIDSDKDDIKSFLTREHHYFCYQKKWIDDYSLECCEKRYKHYEDEGGNSFIKGFMEEMRALPKHPPDEK